METTDLESQKTIWNLSEFPPKHEYSNCYILFILMNSEATLKQPGKWPKVPI